MQSIVTTSLWAPDRCGLGVRVNEAIVTAPGAGPTSS